MSYRMLLFVALGVISLVLAGRAANMGVVRRESFDRDPGWEGINNRAASPEPREIRQDFGYSRTSHAGGAIGEAGGFITPAGEPAYYAKRITARSLNAPLEASGKFTAATGSFNVLVGFFNHRTINEWRTPNSLALRFYGRGDVFYPYLEYCTSRWRAGADSPGGFATVSDPRGGMRLRGLKVGVPHTWSLRYDPQGNGGRGSIAARVDDETAICHLGEGHKEDGAAFTRFGLLNVVKSADGAGEVWLDDLTVNGEREEFSKDPRWDSLSNRKRYLSQEVRPRFDFGFSATGHAGGTKKGEVGGRVFRGDDRSAATLASYADRIGPLDLTRPIRASGRVSLLRAVSDSTSLLGFFSSTESLRVRTDGRETMTPPGFIGLAVEGPSREGFFVYPLYHLSGEKGYANGDDRPRIYPDGRSHAWSLDFDPQSRALRATLGAASAVITLDPKVAAAFDRFGIITTTTDGNAQRIYFDDLVYTSG